MDTDMAYVEADMAYVEAMPTAAASAVNDPERGFGPFSDASGCNHTIRFVT
jgi:hypothetical protein